jgi:hypothetical protein
MQDDEQSIVFITHDNAIAPTFELKNNPVNSVLALENQIPEPVS